jgi:hypothetical protein
VALFWTFWRFVTDDRREAVVLFEGDRLMSAPVFTIHASGTTPGDAFLAMLPPLKAALRNMFSRLLGESLEEAFHEGIANAFVAFVALWQRGRQHVAAPQVLARYAARQYFDGRRVGSTSNSHDVLSPYGRRRHRITVESLSESDDWQASLAGNRRTSIPDQVAFLVDFPDWLQRLSPRKRRMALLLSQVATTSEVARELGLSEARVSQVRRELYDAWELFHENGPSARALPSRA